MSSLYVDHSMFCVTSIVYIMYTRWRPPGISWFIHSINYKLYLPKNNAQLLKLQTNFANELVHHIVDTMCGWWLMIWIGKKQDANWTSLQERWTMDGQRCIWHKEPKKTCAHCAPIRWNIGLSIPTGWRQNGTETRSLRYSILTLFHSMWFCYLYVV